MNKAANIHIALDPDTLEIFQSASAIVSKTGLRVPTGQLVQTMINAELSRLSARKIAQRFLKSIMQQVGALSGIDDEDEEEALPKFVKPPAL